MVKIFRLSFLCTFFSFYTHSTLALSSSTTTRRKVFTEAAHTAISVLSFPTIVTAATNIEEKDASGDIIDYHNRNRNKNKDAVIREDIWYMTGKIPPRRLNPNFVADDGPEYNAWGACTTSSTGNSCTYVPLNLRIPGYSKYAFNIALGAREYTQLGLSIDELFKTKNLTPENVEKSLSYLQNSNGSSSPPPSVDSLLKMVLMATAMLTTPNYSGPPKELLVARFYINETSFALAEILSALEVKDIDRAKAAWEFGRDSWNSYFILVNRAIVPKVGDKFELIA